MSSTKDIHIGTSGWSYNHWKGRYYPDNISGENMLAEYVRHFSTVEINATFYRLQSEETLLNWKQSVPDHFIFAVKGSRYVTHMKKLKDPAKSVKKFFDQVHILGHKKGPILFQLPPSWHKNTYRLAAFLNVLPHTYRYAIEFRDHTWFDNDIFGLLEKRNMALCIYDLEEWISPLRFTADFGYVRLHGPGARYQGSYSRDMLIPWRDRFRQWSNEGKEVFCYFNNDYEAHAPRNALLLMEMLESM